MSESLSNPGPEISALDLAKTDASSQRMLYEKAKRMTSEVADVAKPDQPKEEFEQEFGADLAAYLKNRPFMDKKGNVHEPEKNLFSGQDADKYFNASREDHFESSNKSYEDMTLSELKRIARDANEHGDRSTLIELMPVIDDKLMEIALTEEKRGQDPKITDKTIDDFYKSLGISAEAEGTKADESPKGEDTPDDGTPEGGDGGETPEIPTDMSAEGLSSWNLGKLKELAKEHGAIGDRAMLEKIVTAYELRLEKYFKYDQSPEGPSKMTRENMKENIENWRALILSYLVEADVEGSDDGSEDEPTDRSETKDKPEEADDDKEKDDESGILTRAKGWSGKDLGMRIKMLGGRLLALPGRVFSRANQLLILNKEGKVSKWKVGTILVIGAGALAYANRKGIDFPWEDDKQIGEGMDAKEPSGGLLPLEPSGDELAPEQLEPVGHPEGGEEGVIPLPLEGAEETLDPTELMFEDKIERGDGITYTLRDRLPNIAQEDRMRIWRDIVNHHTPEQITEMFPGSTVTPQSALDGNAALRNSQAVAWYGPGTAGTDGGITQYGEQAIQESMTRLGISG